MKRVVLGMALAIALAAVPRAAAAQEGTMPDWANKSGGVGIGGNTTLGGANGLNIRTYVTPLFGIHLTLGFSLDSQTDTIGGEDTTYSQRTIAAALYGSYKLAYWQRGALSAIFGVDIENLNNSVDSPAGGGDDSTTDFLIGVGLMGEWFPTQYLSLFLQAGLQVDFLGDEDAAQLGVDPVNNDVSGIDLSLGGDVIGAAGFTVWFK